jgi:hypothetical protein
MIFLVRLKYSPTKCIFSPTKFNLVRQMQFSPTKCKLVRQKLIQSNISNIQSDIFSPKKLHF